MKKLIPLILVIAMLLTACGGGKDSGTNSNVQNVTITDAPSGIFVTPIEGLSDDFVLGCDVSSLIAEENSGVKYYNEDGEEQDLLLTLAEHGVNTIRIRVWNNPFDANGNGYGGGNNDLATAIAIGTRATQYGMGVLIDFHYSDFWADPAKQMCPKAWEGMTLEEKQTALYDFTYDSLKQLLDAGVNVTMVQVGNETTRGMSGENKFSSVCKLMVYGCNAIDKIEEEYSKEILSVVHFTNPEDYDQYISFAKNLDKFEVNYDIFGSSYYPYWHGTLDNLTKVLSDIATTYNKKVMVTEVSYAYTMENGDDFGNSISEGSTIELPYATTVQGQADCIRDVAAAVAAVGEAGVGICYWEPAWIPIPGADYEERLPKWEKYGSGWASSYAAEYDPDDAGVWYGGCSWDNQAMFDFEGKPLASLSVFRFLKTGATTDVVIDSYVREEVKIRLKQEIILPETVTVKFNDGSTKDLSVTWDPYEIDTTVVGKTTVTGKADNSGEDYAVSCVVNMVELNYVENDSFEDEDLSMWTITNIDESMTELFVIDKSTDAVSGTKSLHWYTTSATGGHFTCEQTITGLKPGTYKFSIVLHGGDASEQDIKIYAKSDSGEYEAATQVTAWQELQYPVIAEITTTDGTITVGADVFTGTGSWGNLDDFILAPVEK